MKKMIVLIMLIFCNLVFSKTNEKVGAKTMKFIGYELSEQKNIIDK